MHAIELTAFGPPKEVLHMVDLPEPGAPKADEVLVQVELAPINFNDLYIFRGTFHYTPELPTLVGNEGVGRVLSVGSDVRQLKPGDRSSFRATATRGESAWSSPRAGSSRCHRTPT